MCAAECPVCYEELRRCAVLVPCRHELCTTCAAKLQALAVGAPYCPLCRLRFERFIERAPETRACSVCFDRCALAEDECRAKQVAAYARSVEPTTSPAAAAVSLASVRAALDDTKAWQVSSVRRDAARRKVVVLRQTFARVSVPSSSELYTLRGDACRRDVAMRVVDRHEEPPTYRIDLTMHLRDLMTHHIRRSGGPLTSAASPFHRSVANLLVNETAHNYDDVFRLEHIGSSVSIYLR